MGHCCIIVILVLNFTLNYLSVYRTKFKNLYIYYFTVLRLINIADLNFIYAPNGQKCPGK